MLGKDFTSFRQLLRQLPRYVPIYKYRQKENPTNKHNETIKSSPKFVYINKNKSAYNNVGQIIFSRKYK